MSTRTTLPVCRFAAVLQGGCAGGPKDRGPQDGAEHDPGHAPDHGHAPADQGHAPDHGHAPDDHGHAPAPGGQLVIVDFKPGDFPVGPKGDHKLPGQKVIGELEDAGYDLAWRQELPYQYVLAFGPR